MREQTYADALVERARAQLAELRDRGVDTLALECIVEEFAALRRWADDKIEDLETALEWLDPKSELGRSVSASNAEKHRKVAALHALGLEAPAMGWDGYLFCELVLGRPGSEGEFRGQTYVRTRDFDAAVREVCRLRPGREPASVAKAIREHRDPLVVKARERATR